MCWLQEEGRQEEVESAALDGEWFGAVGEGGEEDTSQGPIQLEGGEKFSA